MLVISDVLFSFSSTFYRASDDLQSNVKVFGLKTLGQTMDRDGHKFLFLRHNNLDGWHIEIFFQLNWLELNVTTSI